VEQVRFCNIAKKLFVKFFLKKIFPHNFREQAPVAGSTLARIKEKRRLSSVQPEKDLVSEDGD
jgi:hypothetical protein